MVIALLVGCLALGIGPWLGAAQAMDCTADAFNALGLTDEEFGLPVTGITSTLTSTTSYATSPPAVIEYCDVKGTIWPEITFEVMLPMTTWNQRLYMAGNSNQAGSIPAASMVQGLWRGYAATGTDTGHDAAKYPGLTYADPAYNPNWDQASKDFAYRSVHETVVIAKKIIQAYYESATVYSYWVGCSTGGRQGLKEAQKYPEDFDGIVAGSQVGNRTVLMLGPAYLNPQAPTGGQSQIPPDKLSMLGKAVYDKCDGIDGLVDGIIDDPRNCTFDPDQDLQKCPGDIDGPACFTIEQITALKKIYSGALSNGTLIMPGIPKGAEALPYKQGWYGTFVDTTLEQTSRYQTTLDAFEHVLQDIFPPGYDFLTQWNWDTDPPKLAAMNNLGYVLDPDLSAFKAHGGKLLMYHGWADAGPNPLTTSMAYYNSVYAFMGDQTKDVLAFYMVPGMAHCGGGVGCGKVDWFSPLVNWVEKGVPPGSLIGSSTTSTARTRPICRYPEVARYIGTGSTDDASNFVCVHPVINTITASAGEGGSISPTGAITVAPGGIQGYTITMDPGYVVTDVLVDGISVGAVTSYLFTSVRESHTISASFGAANGIVTLTQTVVDTAGNPVVGAQVEMVGNPAYSAVTDAFGTFVLSVPQGVTFAYSISKTGFLTWYSESYLNLTSSIILDKRIIYTDADISGWGVNPGYGALRGQALEAGTSRPINNPTVSAASTLYPGISYAVTYDSACGSGTGTCLYTVINVAANDAVLLTVSAPGYITKQVQLNPLPASAVGQAFAYLEAEAGQSYDLGLTMTGDGSGAVTFSQGYNCSGTCKQEFNSGTPVTLNPAAAAGSAFSGWTGCDSMNGDACTVSMTSARSVSVNFTRLSPGTGTVYGRVTDSSGSGVANALVRVVREYESSACSGPSCMLVNTDSYGNYLIGNIIPGSYIGVFLNQPVQFGTSGGMVYTTNQYYNNKHSMASADLVAVNEGSAIELDAAYPLFGQISGTVTDTNGAGIGNITVQVYNLDEEYIDAGWTNASGNYIVQHVPSGTYKIRFKANAPSLSLAAQNLMTQVVYVTVTAPNSVTGINATMSPGRNISGKITNKDGLPVAGNAAVSDLYGNNIALASTDMTGAYTAMGIPPGNYKVSFSATPGSPVDATKLYTRQFYGGDPYAIGVTVPADADVSDINGVLEVSGPAVSVSVYKDFGVEVVGMSSYRSFTVTNRGTADLAVGTLSKTGDDFNILNDRCSGVTLAPTKICTFQVAFLPLSEGAKTGSITIPSNSADVPVVNISLTGSGGAATGSSGTTSVMYGEKVTSAPTNSVSLTFANVTSAEGTVTATAISVLTSTIPNFMMLNGASYDITTTATFTGPVTVCIIYDEATMSNPANEQNLRLFHYSGGVWQDITTSVDTTANKICGVSDSLSPFAVAEPVSGEQLINNLVTTVNSLDLKQGITTSLDAKLQAAEAALDAARANDRTTACNLMNAFMDEVAAQSGNMITADQAGQLTAATLPIKTALGCP